MGTAPRGGPLYASPADSNEERLGCFDVAGALAKQQTGLNGQPAKSSSASQTGRMNWSGRPGSNRRHLPWQGSTLPLSYSRPCLSKYSGPEPYGQRKSEEGAQAIHKSERKCEERCFGRMPRGLKCKRNRSGTALKAEPGPYGVVDDKSCITWD